jgi:hypothetical protein
LVVQLAYKYSMRSLGAQQSAPRAAAAWRHNPCCCHASPATSCSATVVRHLSINRNAVCFSGASASSCYSNPSIRTASKIRSRPAASPGTAAAEAPAASVILTPPVKLPPEVKAKHKRPPGWVAPGPSPIGLQDSPAAAAAAVDDASLQPQANETLSYLTGDWRIFQLKDGHR